MQEKQLQLVTYEQAKKLKELGFDWECTAFYDLNENNELDYFANQVDWNNEVDTFSAPTVALALKWFRDVKGINNNIGMNDFCDSMIYYGCYVIQKGNIGIYKNTGLKSDLESTYEAAESALLDALLEHCEKEVQDA